MSTPARSPLKDLVRTLRVPSADFYAEVDMEAAKRIGGGLWIIGAGFALLMAPLASPTVPLGAWGWGVLLAIVACGVLAGVQLLRRPDAVGPNELLISSYIGVGLITSVVYLDGSTTYQELFLLSLIYTAAVHPPRRVLPYLLVLTLAVFAPLLYDGWDRDVAAASLARLLIWWGIAGVVMTFVARVRLQRIDLRRDGEAAQRLARVDALTGLGNRRAFDEALEASFARASRSGSPLSLIVADLDDFKEINDRFGHQAGDEVLRVVADTLRQTLRTPDSCFRWGGDEFAILADVGREGAERLAERVRDSIAAECVRPDGSPLEAQTGVAELEVDGPAEALVTAADLDLLAAKDAA